MGKKISRVGGQIRGGNDVGGGLFSWGEGSTMDRMPGGNVTGRE